MSPYITGFSLTSWYSSNSLAPGSTLSPANADSLLTDLGILSYMSADQCDFTSVVYSPNVNLWRKGNSFVVAAKFADHLVVCMPFDEPNVEIFTLPWHSPALKLKKTLANIFQWKTPVTWPKNWHWFFYFLGVICCFSINIRTEVHFFVCIGKWKDTRVNLWEALCTSQELHVTRVLSFPNANKKVYFNP